jgi:membrane protein DedA with SNARE-associated domain
LFSSGELTHLLAVYGYWMVAGTIGLEGIGIPIPGETTLILAAVYAGSTHQLDISMVIAAAAAGSIIGNSLGFWIGRVLGYRALLRYGHHVRLTEGRIKLGQYLFQRHGGKIVFFGRFVPLLRMLAALLAGVNRMGWPPFVVFNVAGGILWACVYGLGGYYLGQGASRLAEPVEIGLGVGIVIVVALGAIFLHRHEARLVAEAHRALPGPLSDPGGA